MTDQRAGRVITLALIAFCVLLMGATTMVDFPTQVKRGPVIDVRGYGAKGNGVADDTAAIQAAINAAAAQGGGTVRIPAGTYPISSTLEITASHIDVAGDGIGASIITRTGDFGDSIYAENVSNVIVSGLSMRHAINYSAGPPPTVSNKPTSGAHVHFFNVHTSSIRDNQLWSLPYGINLDGTGYVYVERNQIKGVWDYANANVQIGIAGIFMQHSANGTAGFPTYAYIHDNVLLGEESASRPFTVNGDTITQVEPIGFKYGIWVSSCEVCEIRNNSIEWMGYYGVYIATLVDGASKGLLQITIDGNNIDKSRLANIAFDMSANEAGAFALNTKIQNNRLNGGSAGVSTINNILFAKPVTPGTYVRTAADTLIQGNIITASLGAGIAAYSSGRTMIKDNAIDWYNVSNSFPTYGLTCSPRCSGDREGSSGVYLGDAANRFTVTNNTIGGVYSGGGYDGVSVFTVGGVGIGYDAGYGTPFHLTAPNYDGGVQAPTARTPAVAYDPAFLVLPGSALNANLSAVTHSGACGTLWAGSTPLSGKVTSGTTGACTFALDFSLAYANGWACSTQNITTPANIMQQNSVSNTGAGFTGTTTSGDVVTYYCLPY